MSIRSSIKFLLFYCLIPLIALETYCQFKFSVIVGDDVYLDTLYNRIMNSKVTVQRDDENYSLRYGFVLSANKSISRVIDNRTIHITTNSSGFRTHEFSIKSPATKRIMLIGDSMIFGMGVDDSETVSACMNSFSGAPRDTVKKIEVFNLGIPGYNTVQEYAVARDYISKLEPDLLVLGLFVGNDIIPNSIAQLDEEGDYSLNKQSVAELKSKIQNDNSWWFLPSALVRIIVVKAFAPRYRYRLAMSDSRLSYTTAMIDKFKRLCGKHDAQLMVVVFYPRDAVYGGLVGRWSNSRAVGEAVYDYCKKKSIETVDFFRATSTTADKHDLFNTEDPHLSPLGNRLVATDILQKFDSDTEWQKE